MSNKTNPKNIPRTQADVDKAFDKGIFLGLKEAEILLIWSLVEKHEHEVDIVQVWNDILKVENEMAEGRLNLSDIRNTLKKEYGIQFNMPPLKYK